MIIAYSAAAAFQVREQPSLSEFLSSELPVLHVDAGSLHETKRLLQAGRKEGFKIHVHYYDSWSLEDFSELLHLSPEFLTLQKRKPHELTFLYEKAKSAGLDVGIALSVEEALTWVTLPVKHPHHLMLMTTFAGLSGRRMHPDTFRAMRRLRRLFPHLPLWVDGGVNADNAPVLRLYGVKLAVSGSFLAQSSDPRRALQMLRREEAGPQVLVSDVMWLPEELPVFPLSAESSPLLLFDCVEQGHMGFALVVGPDNKLIGLTTGADLRKGVILSRGNVTQAPMHLFYNSLPVTLNPGDQLALIWQINENATYPYLYFPVVDDVGHLCGAVVLNHLIRYHV
jgi:pentose-5-phosphate-3-epimerase